jgi:exopolyphosphatase/guanosine-5'-triphosphate,3'-diphosphate pyrophosphatase
MLADIEVVADARRPLLTYAALVLEYIIRVAKPKTIVFSTFGVREGLLYEMLPPPRSAKDGLICAAQTLNELLSRSRAMPRN